MTNPLVPFSFESHQVRVLTDDHGEPLFVAKDVAEALGYKDPTTAIKSHCRGVQELHPIQDALGRPQDVRVIREPDLYRLIFGSTLESAQAFERMVVDDILPSIRKTGKYETAAHVKPAPQTRPREIREAFTCCMSIAKLCGLKGNFAALAADIGTRTLTGVSALALTGQTHLAADPRGQTYTPTEIGKMLDPALSAVKVNRLIETKGLQVKDIKGEWMPSDAAQNLCEWLDTNKRHSDGTPVKQLKWFASVVAVLAQEDAA